MLVTLWTSKGEQIDLNLREDATIGQLKQTLVNEFGYNPQVRLMHGTRMCADHQSVDDYPTGTLVVIGSRQAPPPAQYHTTPSGGVYDPYGQHASSGGSTLRTGQSGGMRQAAEKKYATEYSNVGGSSSSSTASRGAGLGGGNTANAYGYARTPQPAPSNAYQQQPPTSSSTYDSQQYPSQYGTRAQQQAPSSANTSHYNQPSFGSPVANSYSGGGGGGGNNSHYGGTPTSMGGSNSSNPYAAGGVGNTSYANYMSSAAARGANASASQGMGGWNSSALNGASATRTRSPQKNTTYQSPLQQQPQQQSNYPQYNRLSPQRSPPRATTYGAQRNTAPQFGGAGGQQYAPPPSASSSAYSNGNTNTSTTFATPYSSGASSQQQSHQPKPPTNTATNPQPPAQTSEDDEIVFPDITVTGTTIGQGVEKDVTVRINGDASVHELVALLVAKAPEVGATLKPDAMKIMFFNKYVRNWNDSIRKIPLVEGSNFIVCTGHLIDEQQMTLHSAVRAMDSTRNAMRECDQLGEVPMPSNKKNYWLEQLMKALLNLDSLQDVAEEIRQRRKQLVKEVTALQDILASK